VTGQARYVRRLDLSLITSLAIAVTLSAAAVAAALAGQFLAALWGGMCALLVAGTALRDADRPLWRRRLIDGGVEDTWHTRRLLAVLCGGVVDVPRAAELTGLPRWEVALLLARLEAAGWVAPSLTGSGLELTRYGLERSWALLREPMP